MEILVHSVSQGSHTMNNLNIFLSSQDYGSVQFCVLSLQATTIIATVETSPIMSIHCWPGLNCFTSIIKTTVISRAILYMCQQLSKVVKVELGDFIINKIFYCLHFGIHLDTCCNSLCPSISSYLSVSTDFFGIHPHYSLYLCFQDQKRNRYKRASYHMMERTIESLLGHKATWFFLWE